MAWQKLSLSPKARLQLLVGILAFGVLFAVWKFPQWQVGAISDAEKRISAETAARVALIQGVGGLLLFGTAYISFLNLKATQRNVLIAEEKQVTERFSKAVEMLSNENSIHTRLGGIYALERIANDSDKDYWQVMEVLTAFVRERSPYPPSEETQGDKQLPTDIQAVLTVIGRRKHSYGNGEKNGFDLGWTDLRGAFLQGANLVGANLASANLQRVWLQDANLEEACLHETNLQGGWLQNTNLRDTDLTAANLYRAKLQNANLEDANLQHANLQVAKLQHANLQRADLSNANLCRTNLSDADLHQANLWHANLQEAIFEEANLQEAILEEALRLTQEQLDQAKSYEKATLPQYLKNIPSSN
jgi:uncharacterized protein YjbI with pentapeptide repeats